MRWITTLTALCLIAAHAGCQKADPDFKPAGTVNLSHRSMNEALVQTYSLRHQDDAIIRQHTIYPYHFINNSATLNAVGRREVYVLAHHFRSYPGPLNVNQGDALTPLYQARVKTVVDSMVAAGVPSDRVVVKDELPGGDGLPSDQVVIVLQRMTDTKLTGASAPTAASTPSASIENRSETRESSPE
jgi:hypothetical protein